MTPAKWSDSPKSLVNVTIAISLTLINWYEYPAVNRYYFDHNATTPVAPEVLAALVPALTEVYANASSVHQDGQLARQRLEAARLQVCVLLGCQPRELVFTSGGTESDNLAILGAVRASAKPRKHVITTAIEHPAVLSACAQLEREGVEATYVQPDKLGWIDPDRIRGALKSGTVLISVMHVNNETGVIQPVAEIGRIAREASVLYHSDGVQAAGKILIRVEDLNVDLYSISAHKFCAPKGAGALFVRTGVTLQPLQFGGRHERSRRAGTENVPGAIAMGAAATLPSPDLAGLRDRLERTVLDRVPDVTVNGLGAPRVANTTNLCFEGIEGEAMVIALDLRGFAVSSGSACSSGAVEPSHVLSAMGLPPEMARSSLRFSLGRGNTAGQVDALIEAIAASAAHLRRLSPAYSHV
jgi:cysteine desulfurase